MALSRDGRLRGSTDSGSGRISVALQTFEVGAQFGGSLAPQLAVLLQSLVEDRLQLRRQSRVQLDWRCGHLVQNGFKDDGGSGPQKRLPASRHFVKNDTEGEQICT